LESCPDASRDKHGKELPAILPVPLGRFNLITSGDIKKNGLLKNGNLKSCISLQQ